MKLRGPRRWLLVRWHWLLRRLETAKTLLLIILVGTSIGLSWQFWSSNTFTVRASDNSSPANVTRAAMPSGTLDSLGQPLRIIVHFYNTSDSAQPVSLIYRNDQFYQPIWKAAQDILTAFIKNPPPGGKLINAQAAAAYANRDYGVSFRWAHTDRSFGFWQTLWSQAWGTAAAASQPAQSLAARTITVTTPLAQLPFDRLSIYWEKSKVVLIVGAGNDFRAFTISDPQPYHLQELNQATNLPVLALQHSGQLLPSSYHGLQVAPLVYAPDNWSVPLVKVEQHAQDQQFASLFFPDFSSVNVFDEPGGTRFYTDSSAYLRLYSTGGVEFQRHNTSGLNINMEQGKSTGTGKSQQESNNSGSSTGQITSQAQAFNLKPFDALEIAGDFVTLHGGVPSSVVLAQFKDEVQRGSLSGLSGELQQQGYSIGFAPVINGLPVVGLSAGGAPQAPVQVSVQDDPQGVQQYYRLLRPQGGGSAGSVFLDLGKALNHLQQSQPIVFRRLQQARLTGVSLAYYNAPADQQQDTMEPVWVLEFDDGEIVYLRVRDGQLIQPS